MFLLNVNNEQRWFKIWEGLKKEGEKYGLFPYPEGSEKTILLFWGLKKGKSCLKMAKKKACQNSRVMRRHDLTQRDKYNDNDN